MRALILSAIMCAWSVAVLASDTYTLYDRDWRRDGYAVERKDKETIELYNKDWTRRGYVKKEGDRYTIYDRDWQREGYVEIDIDHSVPGRDR